MVLTRPEPKLKGHRVRVLVVEDDLTLQRGLRDALGGAGHQAVVARDGDHADTLLAAEQFDLVVLDLGLPQLDGLAVLERLRRRRKATPVLILTARDRTEDCVKGLDSGADDYMSKPFELSEFEARVRALLRRGQTASVQLGGLEWCLESRQGKVGGANLLLSEHETAILECLLHTPGRIVGKAELALRLGHADAAAGDNLVEVYVHRLRRKLSIAGAEIRTVRGVGYVLREAPVAE
jgi:DNA-binding response OmpR family regulator